MALRRPSAAAKSKASEESNLAMFKSGRLVASNAYGFARGLAASNASRTAAMHRRSLRVLHGQLVWSGCWR